MTPLKTAALTLLLAAACAEDVPESPSWSKDVQPVLLANCARCHTYPPLGGAPQTFRLDVHGTTELDDGSRVLGAGAMSEYIAERAEAGEMPPRFPLTQRQRDLLRAWHGEATGDGAPLGEARADNSEPRIERVGDFSEADGFVDISYFISDRDRDVVTGTLRATRGSTSIDITKELVSGTGSARWDSGSVAEGSYRIVAELSDGITTVERGLGSVEVDRNGGNTAPTVVFTSPLRDEVFAAGDGSLEIGVAVDDADASDTLALEVELFRRDDVVLLASIADARDTTQIPIDVSDVEPAGLWRVRARVSDGNAEREVTVGPVLVGTQSTSLTLADVLPILQANCAPCHFGGGGSAVPGLDFGFGREDFASEVPPGSIYRRTVDERNMPPVSADSLYEGVDMSQQDRDTLAEWLLGGAPQ